MSAYRQEWARHGRNPAALPLLGLTRHLVIATSSSAAKAIAQRAYRPWRRHIEKLWKERGVAFPLALPAEFEELATMELGFAGSPGRTRRITNTSTDTPSRVRADWATRRRT